MKRIITVITAALVGILLCSCSAADFINEKAQSFLAQPIQDTGEAEATAEPVEIDNSITLGVVDYDTYNPYVTQSATVFDVLGFVYEPLFSMDRDMRTQNVLADSYVIGADGQSITINLKQNITWHDGSVFNADDVLYSMNRIRSSQTRFTRLLENVNAMWSADDYTVCVTFNRAVPDSVSLFIFPIVKNNSLYSNGADFLPIGTGPFYMTYANNTAGLLAYENHHDGRAKIDYIKIRTIPDTEKYVTLFNASEFDVASSDMLDMTTYMPKSNSKVIDYTTNNMVIAGFNTQNEMLGNADIRRGLSLLIDRDAISSHTYFSRASAAQYAINPQSWMNFDTMKRLKPDDSGAAHLFSKAGLLTDNSGRYYFENGDYFTLKILVNNESKERVSAAEQISERFNAFGISANVIKCTYNEFNALIAARNYDMFVGELELLPNNDLTSIVGSGGNIFGYGNYDIDALIAQLATVQTEGDITAVSEVLYTKLHEESPFAPICFIKKSLITSAKIKSGAIPSIEGFARSTEDWSVK